MHFTIGLPTDHVDLAGEFVTGDAVMDCARAAEAAGFDACFVTDHPAPDTKWLAGGGHHALDPFVALVVRGRGHDAPARADAHPRAALPQSAAHREVGAEPRRALGRARDPRVAPGYLKPEFAALGVDFDERNELTDEAIDVMRRRLDRRRDRDESAGTSAPAARRCARTRCSSRTRRSGSAATARPPSGAPPSAARAGCRSRIPRGVTSRRPHAAALEPSRSSAGVSASCASTRSRSAAPSRSTSASRRSPNGASRHARRVARPRGARRDLGRVAHAHRDHTARSGSTPCTSSGAR